ncbi:hypothetical protein YPPY98_1598, partial [Yersinia pestis PY-98]
MKKPPISNTAMAA